MKLRQLSLVFCFMASPLVASEQTYLKSSNSWGFDRFGYSVAIDGDLMVAAAYREDSGTTGVNGDQENDDAENSGAAYVFIRDEDGWRQEAFLKASNTDEEDRFGHAIAISGDTIVVGAEREGSIASGVDGDESDNSVSRAGAAYVFVRAEEGWIQQAYLKANDTEGGERFGAAVAIDGDTIVVGAPRQDALSGAAYVFTRSEGVWRAGPRLKADNADGDDAFGFAVDIEGGQILVGAIGEDAALNVSRVPQGTSLVNNDAQDSGAAYLFEESEGVWSQTYYFKGSRQSAGDIYGTSVALDSGRVLIGAYAHLTGETARGGAAYLYERDGTVWTEAGFFANPVSLADVGDGGDGDLFGWDVALDGDALIIGAPNEFGSAQGPGGDIFDNEAEEAGAAYLYRREGGSWVFKSYLKGSNTEADDRYGWAVALSGDTIVVGARNEDSSARGVNVSQANETGQVESGENSGAVYVLEPGEPVRIESMTARHLEDGTRMTVVFTGDAGATDWRFLGADGSEGMGFQLDLTNDFRLDEVSPGRYEATLITEAIEPKFFLRIVR